MLILLEELSHQLEAFQRSESMMHIEISEMQQAHDAEIRQKNAEFKQLKDQYDDSRHEISLMKTTPAGVKDEEIKALKAQKRLLTDRNETLEAELMQTREEHEILSKSLIQHKDGIDDRYSNFAFANKHAPLSAFYNKFVSVFVNACMQLHFYVYLNT